MRCAHCNEPIVEGENKSTLNVRLNERGDVYSKSWLLCYRCDVAVYTLCIKAIEGA